MELMKGKTSRQFLLFFISQTIVGAAAFLQLVAVASLMVKVTGSGVAAGFGIVCAPLPGILLSLFAGDLGDRLPVKRVMILIDLSRALLTGLFFFCACAPVTAPAIFAFTLALSSFDVLYNPSRNKLMTCILKKEELITGNSLMSGGYGAVSILVPVLAGLLAGRFGAGVVLLLSSLCFAFSALLLSGISSLRLPLPAANEKKRQPGQISHGLRYCFADPKLKNAVFTAAFIDFGTISVNIAFYSFAFDTLRVSSVTWGLMLSVIYGMSLAAMMLLLKFKKFFGRHPVVIVDLLLIVTSAVWFFYSLAHSLGSVLIAEVFEGLSLSLCGTLLLTYLLRNARAEYTARVMGIRDLCSNFSKLLGVAYTYLLMLFFRPGMVFAVTSALLLLFVAGRLLAAGAVKATKRPDRRF